MALKGIMTRGVQSMTASTARVEHRSGTGSEPTAVAPRPIQTQAPGPRTVAPSTSVDASSEFEGRLRCKETLRIDGSVVGSIDCDKTVIIGQGARVHARIDADEVHVSGVVEGDITARRKVTLDRTAVVVGDLTTPGIVIEEGAKLDGRILIGSEACAEAKQAKAATAEASTQSADAAVAASAATAEAAAPAAPAKKEDIEPKKSAVSAKPRHDAPKAGQAAPPPA